jgi:hypothetical protein
MVVVVAVPAEDTPPALQQRRCTPAFIFRYSSEKKKKM